MDRKILMLVNVPSICSKEQFIDVMNGATAAYNYLHRKPTVQEVYRYAETNPKIIAKIYETEEFRIAMRSRGYDFTDTTKLSPQQVWAVSVITNPTNRRPLKDKLAQAGITYHTYRAWLNQPVFAAYIKEIGERLLNDHVQDVHTRVVERAANGDIAAMRLYYDLTGRTDSNTNKAVQDLSATVRLLLEVITRNVTDTVTLDKIQKEIAAVTDGRGTGNSINDFEFESILSGDDGVKYGTVVTGELVTVQDTELPSVKDEGAVGPAIGKDWTKKPLKRI